MAFTLPPWVAAHKPEAAAGALVAVAGTVAYVKKRKAAAASPSTATTPSTAFGTTGSAVDAGTYDSSADDVYNSLEGVLEQLQNTAASMNNTSPITQAIPVTVPSTTLNQTTGTLPVAGGGTITVTGGTPTAVTSPGGSPYVVPPGTLGLAGPVAVATGFHPAPVVGKPKLFGGAG